MKKAAVFLSFVFLSILSPAQNCAQLPAHYRSYDAAITIIRNASFKYADKVNTSKSSWMNGASYYSCDGETGFFIFGAKNKEYIMSGVPFRIWKEFKSADSFGEYYNANIRGRYHFTL